MLRAFVDRGSRDDADGVMCAAMCLFKPTRYKQFSRRWTQMLRELSVPYFHATDFYTSGGLYRTVDSNRIEQATLLLPGLINEHVLQVVGVSFKKKEYEDVAPEEWRRQKGGLYPVAVLARTYARGTNSNSSLLFFCFAGAASHAQCCGRHYGRRYRERSQAIGRARHRPLCAHLQCRTVAVSPFK